MAAKRVSICPGCRSYYYDATDDRCANCGKELIKTQYTDLFWEKITDDERMKHITEVCSSGAGVNDNWKSPFEESYKDLFESVRNELFNDKPIFDLKGCRGRRAKIYVDKVEITTDVTVGSFISGNVTDGTKTIYFMDIIGVQFKESGVLIGYLQFETSNSTQNNASSNFFNENTFTFEESQYSNKFMLNVYYYVINQMNKIKRISYMKQ